MNEISEFMASIKSAGLGNSPEVIPDGNVHRFHVEGDKNNSRNGWYCLFLDGTPAGAMGSRKSGYSLTWRAESSKKLSITERRKLNQVISKAKHQREIERREQQEITSIKAKNIWNNSPDAVFHPYLKRKKILPFGIKQNGDALIMPLRDISGDLVNLQSIYTNGSKYFMKGGKVKGCFHFIGNSTQDTIYICEGFVTGASLFMHHTKKKPVAVAFNAKNLEPVAEAISRKYPETEIVIAADNDTGTPGNPGLTYGREAAAVIGARLIYPNFEDKPFTGTDFNDYFIGGGS